MVRKRPRTSDALQILHRRFYDGNPRRIAELEKARVSAEVARMIYELRTSAGLTQRRLADLVGTSHSVISRLEDDDYTRHSLDMLHRIAAALNRRVEVRFVAAKKARSA
jgi:ribosome-binding protein aMBF1 (putative translation factor)